MLKPVALANATTTIFAIAYISCGIVAYIIPDLYWGILSSWFHSISLEAVKATTPMSLGTFIFGVVSFAVYIWAVSFLGATLYNKFAK